MNENKIKLILKIATSLSDEQCRNILERIEQSPEVICNKLVNLCNELNKDWDESKHPRADDGRFSTTGSMRSQMTKGEAKKWDKTGKYVPASKALNEKRAQVQRLARLAEKYPHEMETRQRYEEAKRELSELIRDTKLEQRKGIERDVETRIMRKKVEEFHDLDDEIDYIEERYADRTTDSPTQGQLVWPKGKRGDKARQKYEDLRKRRDELEEEIEWDRVEDED